MWGVPVLVVLFTVVASVRGSDCSVCSGTNTTCRLVSGIFTRPQLPMGYNLIAQLPATACNLTVTELKQSRNYLALRGIDGNYVLNGNWAINWSGEFEVGGTPFSYTRDDDQHSESIYSPGPLMEPLDLMVIYQQPNPGIKYQYQLPMVRTELSGKESIVRHPPSPTINHIPEDHKPLDNGVDTRPANPVFPYGNILPTTDTHAYPGDEAVKRPRRKRKFAWKITGFTECTKSCGGGIQTAVIACVREHNQLTVTDRRCASFERPHPQTVRCNLKPCIAEWVGGEWSECSVTCGEGVQTREILCRQEITTTLIMTVADGACLTPPSPLLHRIRTCQRPACLPDTLAPTPTPTDNQWDLGLWSECSVTCGIGKRTRTVSCLSGACSTADRPMGESACDMGQCLLPPTLTASPTQPDNTFLQPTWFYTEWTQQCSEGCGTGVQTRKVHCSAGDWRLCPADTQPEHTRACSSDKFCGSHWFTGPWGQCTVNCGWGRQSRSVLCLDKAQGLYTIVSEDHCVAMDKPAAEQPCQDQPCGPDWFTADWTPCSRSCEGGVERREVRCLDAQQQLTDKCSEHTKPPTRRSCNTQQCSVPTPGSIPAVDTGSVKATQSDSHNSAGDQPLRLHPHPEDHECTDKYHNCHLVVQARLCKYKYYRSSCCQACHNKL